jgi:WD40 repeat protein
MRKSFIFVSILISLMSISCTPKQNLAVTQTATLTPVATKAVLPSFTFTPSITPFFIAKSNAVYNMAVNPNGNLIAITREKGIEVYNLKNGDLVYSFSAGDFEGHPLYSYIAWSPHGKFLATGRPSSGIDIWDTSNWKLLTEVKDPQSMGYQISGFDWSPNKDQLALGMRDGQIQIWDSKANTWTPQKRCNTDQVFGLTWVTDNELRIFTNSGIYNASTCEKVQDTTYIMDGCCGYTVVSPDKKNIFLFFDLGGGIINIEKNEHIFGICCYPTIAWSRDGRYFIATPLDSNTVTTVDTLDGSSYVYVFNGAIQAFAWSSNNELLTLYTRDGKSIIQSSRTGQTLVTLK